MNYIYILCGIALTALCWGSYGPVLHEGQALLGRSPFKALICVGAAYFLVGIVVPVAILAMQNNLMSQWTFGGITWAMAAGCAGALGALGIILALTNGGPPWLVMPLVFGCAPVITTVVSLTSKGLWDEANPLFFAGIILVVAGAATVLLTAPRGHKPAADHAKAAETQSAEESSSAETVLAEDH